MKRTDHVRKETVVFSETKRMSTSSSEPLNGKIGEKVREKEFARSPSGKHNSILQFFEFGKKCASRHQQTKEQSSKTRKKKSD